jgi:hypothetical protein
MTWNSRREVSGDFAEVIFANVTEQLRGNPK